MPKRFPAILVVPAILFPAAACGGGPPAGAQKGTRAAKGPAIRFRRTVEPREGAFSVLVPAGWQTDGGILRVNPLAGGGPANAIAAKLDFTVKRDPRGSALMRWLPEMLYFDSRGTPAAALFPPGSQYNGMTVMPLMDAATFLAKVVFPYAHPQARNPQIAERKPMPGLARAVAASLSSLPISSGFTFDAAMLTVNYEEGGARYKEKLAAVVQNWGPAGAGTWGNKETFLVRAAPEEFDRLIPILGVIRSSAEINPQWLAGEIRGQMVRNKIASDTQRYIQEVDRQIVEHRRRTNAEINNDMFLTLTGQEDYINPHTGKVEQGSNQWKHRWVSPSGEEIYTDDADYDPSLDAELQRSDFKRSRIRPR
jgi:hypothetical protein